MPRVVFTRHLERYVSAPPTEVAGRTVRELLDNALRSNPQLRGYVFDDQGQLRRHVVCFVDGRMVQDRAGLTDPVEDGGELFVMQALSGG